MQKNDHVCILYPTGAVSECEINPCVKMYYTCGVGDEAKYTERKSGGIYRWHCKSLSGNDKSHKRRKEEKEKAEGKPHIKLRLPQERRTSESGDMSRASGVARILSHFIT